MRATGSMFTDLSGSEAIADFAQGANTGAALVIDSIFLPPPHIKGTGHKSSLGWTVGQAFQGTLNHFFFSGPCPPATAGSDYVCVNRILSLWLISCRAFRPRVDKDFVISQLSRSSLRVALQPLSSHSITHSLFGSVRSLLDRL